ncbi:MAG: HAMP domain-containing sensor histidine kinase [Candidatus Microsaccharimonas sp.]
MLIETVPLIVSNAIAIIMVLIILVSRTVAFRLRVTLVATIISLLVWQNSIFIADSTPNNALILNTLVFLWPTAAIASCFWFIRLLKKNVSQKNHNEWISVLFCVALLLQFIPIFTFTIFSKVYFEDGVLNLERAYGYAIYLVGIVVSMGLLVTEILIQRHRSRIRSTERYAINTVLITVILATGYGVMFNIVLPVITNSQSLIKWGMLVIAIFAIGLSLSIAKGRLLDIKLYAIRSVVYILTLITLAVLYGFIAFIVSQKLLGYTDSTLQTTINIALALTIAFIFQPTKQFFDRVTNRIFFRDSLDSGLFLSRFNKLLTSTSNLRVLLSSIAKFIAENIRVENASFVIYRDDRRRVASIGYPKAVDVPIKDAQILDEYIRQNGGGVIVTGLVHDKNPHIYRLLVSHRIGLVLPLLQSGVEVGYFLLSPHPRGDYSQIELRTLETIANELVVSIQNALSIEEIRDLNTNLEQRIQEATGELRASNAQLHRLDETKDEFISMASHQLRTPLTSIKGYLSMLMEGDVGEVTKDQKHVLNEAFISSERMVRLIGDFLNVSRLQTGKFVIDKHPVDLALLVQREIEGLEANAAARGMKFTYKKPKNIPMLSLDENKIQQVVMNFSDNAIYYSRENATIKVVLKKIPGFVEFKVIDSGIGVPVQEQENLFSKFFRATNARRARPDGTGVGLFLAKKVIDEHGGTILFESTEGKGSTFGFRLPITEK